MGKSKYGMVARLVWDGGDEVRIPEELGAPAPNQMQGTPGERLSEVSGRTCYDSLGKGRSSEDYHKHILEVKHGSVYEHFNMTVRIDLPDPKLEALLNRPGIWTRLDSGDISVTFNPRSILDWDYWSRESEVDDLVGSNWSTGDILAHHMERACPNIVIPRMRPGTIPAAYDDRSEVVPPKTHEQKWISLFMMGSRGFSHEQVRHKFRTGVSQRSTRFVNESESPWFDHPLVQEFFLQADVSTATKGRLNSMIGDTVHQSRQTYTEVNDELYKWLLSRGVDKVTARKQARGAARGYLGNALSTELIFSASVAQWKRMLRMRCSAPADGEIRAEFVEVLTELRKSRYADEFEAFELVPAGDGLGSCSVERVEQIEKGLS